MTTAEVEHVLQGSRQWAVECRDCLDFLRELPDQSAVVITDVPYQAFKPGMANDSLPWCEFVPWLDERIRECFRVGRRVFSTFSAARLVRYIRDTTIEPTRLLHWHKPFMLHGRSMNGSPFLAHGEPILYWGPETCKEAGKRGYDSFSFNAMRPFQRRAEGLEAPTPKPKELMLQCVEFWSDPDDLVIDPFCGSGTTVVAAVAKGRKAIGIDIDPERATETRQRMLAEDRGVTLGSVKRGQGALF